MPQLGVQSIQYSKPVHIISSASVVGTKEGEGPLKELFDIVAEDDLLGCDNWEESEGGFVKEAVSRALFKSKDTPKEIRYVFGGDLLAQSVASTYSLLSFDIPLFGIFGACSTCGEGLGLASMTVAGGFAHKVMAVTSSHFASAEKEFRFPLDYGNQRPLCSTWTVTGSGAFILAATTDDNSVYKHCGITGITTGKIVDFGLKDNMNMGCCMAPAAADTIYRHLKDNKSLPEEYDRIITGDLGSVGQKALIDLLREKGYDIADRHMDCGIEIFDSKSQDTQAGGSGCACSAVTLSAMILPKIESGEWKRVLFVPTGALLSKVSFNEGQTVPGIAHGVVIEHVD